MTYTLTWIDEMGARQLPGCSEEEATFASRGELDAAVTSLEEDPEWANTEWRVEENSAAETWAIGDRVEGGDTPEDYDTGRVTAVDGDQVTVAWDSQITTTQSASTLRTEGDLVLFVSEDDIEALLQEAGVAGDTAQVELCTGALGGNEDDRAECVETIATARREHSAA